MAWDVFFLVTSTFWWAASALLIVFEAKRMLQNPDERLRSILTKALAKAELHGWNLVPDDPSDPRSFDYRTPPVSAPSGAGSKP